jgi:hypothetical protein
VRVRELLEADHGEPQAHEHRQREHLLPPRQVRAAHREEADEREGDDVDDARGAKRTRELEDVEPGQGEEDQRHRGRGERLTCDPSHPSQLGRRGEGRVHREMRHDVGDEARHRDPDDAHEQGEGRLPGGEVLDVPRLHQHDREPGEGGVDALLQRLGAFLDGPSGESVAWSPLRSPVMLHAPEATSRPCSGRIEA